MKVTFVLLLLCVAPLVMAQQPPMFPPAPNHQGRPIDLRDQNPNQPQWDDSERRRQWREERRLRRWCDEQRERVERHPRIPLPRVCWRR